MPIVRTSEHQVCVVLGSEDVLITLAYRSGEPVDELMLYELDDPNCIHKITVDSGEEEIVGSATVRLIFRSVKSLDTMIQQLQSLRSLMVPALKELGKGEGNEVQNG